MSAVLIGAEIDSALPTLHASLRASTVEYARRKFGRVIREYSPWLCFAPIVDEIDPKLIYFTPATRGDLVLDDDFLDTARDFLADKGLAAITDLPHEPSVWLPGRNNISDVFEDAVAIIRRSHPVLWDLYTEMVDYIVPLGGGRNRGYSTHLARGAIFRSLPADNDAYDVAIDVIHEVGHQVLNTWQSVDPILTSPLDAPVYSLIRRVDRPAIQSFHAAVALAYMRYLEKSMPDDPGMQAAGARRGAAYTNTLSHSLQLAIDAIRSSCTMTELGEMLLQEMEAQV